MRKILRRRKSSLLILFFILLCHLNGFSQQCFCYDDRDGDGYGDPNTARECFVGACSEIVDGLGNFLYDLVDNNLDCDDTDADINPFTTWYKDADDDGFTDGSTLIQCAKPVDYKLQKHLKQGWADFGFVVSFADLIDCDDTKTNYRYQFLYWFVDTDLDGFVADKTNYFVSCVTPIAEPGIVYIGIDADIDADVLSNLKDDCNDHDPLITIEREWYLDGDGDGFPLNNTPEYIQCNAPPGGFFKAKDQLLSSEFEDCDDRDPAIHPATWYEDKDDDGLSSGQSIIACGQPEGYISLPGGASLIDCNDTDPEAGLVMFWYADVDGDHSGGASTWSCSRPPGLFKPSELSSLEDCNDNDPTIHPDATEFCNGKDDDCDFQIDETYCCPSGNIIYVNAANTGIQDGTSWAKAYKRLPDALDAARSCAHIEQIWVAGGTYYPDEGGTATNNNFNIPFMPKDDLEIYGGFVGTETLLSQRNLSSAPSILSGEIQQDNVQANNTNNVVVIDNANTNLVLDGFTIRDGYSNIAFPENKSRGIGILVLNSSAVRIRNCIITQNTGTNGVAITNVNSNVTYTNCVITGNTSLWAGGAIINENGTPSFINCSIANNSGNGTEFIVQNFGTASPIIINTIVRGTSPAMIGGTPIVGYSLIQNESVWPGTGNIIGDPLFVNEAAGDLRLLQGSPGVNTGINNFNSEEKDIEGNSRKIATIDMGAYESPYTCADPSLWVIDKDEDGYYPGDPISACETPGEGYVVKSNELPGDCNDDDKTINPTTIWYIDTDNDGYYRTGVVYGPTCTPTGPEFNTTTTKGPDCNDNNASINPETVWYRDQDKDGYNSRFFVTQTSCTSPGPEYVTSTLGADCDDNNNAIGAPVPEICDGIDNDCDGFIDEGVASTYYKDADNDGYTDGTTLIQCARPAGYKLNSELSSDEIDCNDANAGFNPQTIWYKDLDGDRFSDGETRTQCSRPEGYRLQSELTQTYGDCDDDRGFLHPLTEWYKDEDDDGFSDGTSTLQCVRPEGYKLKIELIVWFGDCDDNDPSIKYTPDWYKDADNDGYSNGTNLHTCSRPEGYKLESELTAITGDCDDTNAAINPTTEWYKDADNDLYSDGTTQTQCARPANYKLASELTATTGDCNDADGAVQTAIVWYKDADNDLYSDGTTQTGCTRPANYKLASELTATTGDCDDANGGIKPTTVWYKDGDNDLYSDGTTQTQCTRPANYKLASELTATTGDCNDASTAIKPTTVWYKDADNDLYSNGTTLTQCTRPANYKLASELTATTGDCNDGNVAINPAAAEICDGIDNDCDGAIDEGVKLTFYKDADADGYGNAAQSVQACSAPAGYVSNNTDCSDNDPTVNPGAVEVCGNGKDDNCSRVQNEPGCYTCGNATAFSTTNITSNSATLNWVSIPHPNYWQLQYKSTKPGSKWVDVKPDPTGNKRSVQITGLSSNQDYLWHIKARCGNSWTDYNVSVNFKTTGSTVLTRPVQTTAEPENSISADNITVYPNPTNGIVNLNIQLKSMVTTATVISLTDINGRTIYQQKTDMVKGVLNTKIQMPGNAAAGVYVMQVVVDGQSYQYRLVYVK